MKVFEVWRTFNFIHIYIENVKYYIKCLCDVAKSWFKYILMTNKVCNLINPQSYCNFLKYPEVEKKDVSSKFCDLINILQCN